MKIVFLGLFVISTACWADGPGSRIRATPLPPQPPGVLERDLERCERMRGEEKERCLRALRAARQSDDRPPHAGPAPETSGMASGAGTGASAGRSAGGGTVGGAPPR